MADHEHTNAALVEVAERNDVSLSGMKGLVDFFSAEVTIISDPKDLTETYLRQVTNYTREAYLSISLLLRCDHIIYGNIIKDMGNNYSMD